MTTMTRLALKDWRVYRAAAIGGVVVLLIPYAMAMFELIGWDGRGADQVSGLMRQAASLGLWLTVVTAAVFGGAAFAAERRDHSAEFVALVPLPRLSVVGSKLGAALTCLFAVWGVHAFVLIVARTRESLEYGYMRPDDPVFNGLWNSTSVAVMAFGVAWLVSSFVSSPAIAASFSVALTVVTLVVTIDLAGHELGTSDIASAIEFALGSRRTALMEGRASFSGQGVARLVMWVLGVLAWSAGTALFVRRVSP